MKPQTICVEIAIVKFSFVLRWFGLALVWLAFDLARNGELGLNLICTGHLMKNPCICSLRRLISSVSASVSQPCCEQHVGTGVCDGRSTQALGLQTAPLIFA